MVGAIALAMTAAGPAALASAHPPKPVNKKGKRLRGPWHRYLHQAKVPVVNGRLKVILTGCPGQPSLGGCVFTRRRHRIYLNRRMRDRRAVFYHELGHLFDLRVMRRRHRRTYRRIFGLGRRRWFGGRRPPAEHFAEAYSYCARYRRVRGARTNRHARYGYRATRGQHRAVCALIRTAGERPPRRPEPPPNPPPVIVEPPANDPAATVPEPPPPRPPRSGVGTLLDAIF